MKTHGDYKYREIAGEYYLIPVGAKAEKESGAIQLSETAAWIWRQIEKDLSAKEMAEKMTQEYDVDPVQAQAAVERFLASLRDNGFLI